MTITNINPLTVPDLWHQVLVTILTTCFEREQLNKYTQIIIICYGRKDSHYNNLSFSSFQCFDTHQYYFKRSAFERWRNRQRSKNSTISNSNNISCHICRRNNRKYTDVHCNAERITETFVSLLLHGYASCCWYM